MIKSDHKSWTLFWSHRQKVGVQIAGLEQTNIFTRPKIWKSFLKVMHFCKTVWEISNFFNISHILNFWKMLFRSLKKVCDEFSKFKNLRRTFFFFFRAHRCGIWLFFRIQNCLVVNWPRKWAVFHFYKNSKISQNVLQKSATFQNNFLIFGRVKLFVGPSTSFLTPDILSGASWKALNFMIPFDHELISSDLFPRNVPVKYQ